MHLSFEGDQMRKALSVYLYVLGVVQLLGLNLGRFFWLAWASGIRQAKPSSRRWVIAIHSIYLAIVAVGLTKWSADPDSVHMRIFGYAIDVSPNLILTFFLLMIVIYGLPVVCLMSKRVRQEFIK